ncbi:Arm DNA-binding domain-containing protein [Flavobacterium sp. UMI-01]|uniref:Arm DNA-binding domain-containing protein n=1 Tax=Flavobacterium sp. UMI-01 TaxID=1441053 RepID=UPI001C7DF1DD|nr:Arm DNA-binding domain-containing protein [Flavobacterium sp. UMI-01]GIZ07915.1 hypothetical protein FUMI01_06420 [Flavobacterium sp. UMI-01]
MKKDNFAILFVLRLNKLNKNGMCPINVRITNQGIKKENATGCFVEPKLWVHILDFENLAEMQVFLFFTLFFF